MKVYIYGYANGYDAGENIPAIVDACAWEVGRLGCRIVWNLTEADVAVAPLLQVKISDAELSKPKHGTLIFHPSLLPRHRGRDAIRWAYHLNETYTGATWFWADSGLDTGDICEQEVVAIGDKRPRDFYEQDIIPVAVRLLRYVILDLKAGIIRRRPQNDAAATYEPPFQRTKQPN
jgi:methionyl-tRNA formyltransferase